MRGDRVSQLLRWQRTTADRNDYRDLVAVEAEGGQNDSARRQSFRTTTLVASSAPKS